MVILAIFGYDAVKESAAAECFTTFYLNLVIKMNLLWTR